MLLLLLLLLHCVNGLNGTQFTTASILQIIPWLGNMHPLQILGKESLSIIRRKNFQSFEWYMLWRQTRRKGHFIYVIEFGVIEKGNHALKCCWYLSSVIRVLECQQTSLVSDGKIMPCGARQIQVVSEGRSHTTVPKMGKHQVE